MPGSYPFRSRRRSCSSSRSTPAGVLLKSANACVASTPRSTARPSAPCMRSWTVTAWLSVDAGESTSPKAPRSPTRTIPMTSGVPTTRASSCSPIDATAFRSPSPTSRAVTSSAVRGSRAPWRCTPLPSLSALLRTSGCPERFEQFIRTVNQERPHEALNMRSPAELYQPSPRPYKALPELEYAFHDRTITITRCGRICFGRQKINLSQAFAGQKVGVKQVTERVWLVSFMKYDLGYFDDETCRIESAENPFAAKLSPMSPV